MTDAILSKKQNYRLWQSGAFGNKLRAWRYPDEWLASSVLRRSRGNYLECLVALRVLKDAGGPCIYDLNPWEVARCRGLSLADYRDEDIMVNEMAPGDQLCLQGEYWNGLAPHPTGMMCNGYFFGSRAKSSMRLALRGREPDQLHVYGLTANLMIREAMTPSSYEDWQVLLDQYPGHVLEVSIFGRCLGDIPGRNALVWEIRRY